jgi:hypothetical protein
MVTAAAAVAVVLGMLGTASASSAEEPGGESPYAPSVLVLTFAEGEEAIPVLRAVSLRCDPDGGDHPAPSAACAAIAATSGDLENLTGPNGMCTLEYRPVTVTARGVWEGRLISYSGTFPNRCALIQRTGPVFGF